MRYRVLGFIVAMFVFYMRTMATDVDSLPHSEEYYSMLKDRNELKTQLEQFDWYNKLINIVFASISGGIVVALTPMFKTLGETITKALKPLYKIIGDNVKKMVNFIIKKKIRKKNVKHIKHNQNDV